MKNKVVSVIVPVYNAERYINKCVDSLLRQSYPNIEVILVDDRSTDSSPMLCDKLAESDSRVKVIHQKNMRIGAARNRGLDESKGDYITFIDSDDYLELNAYEECIALLDKYNADMVQWDLTFVPEPGCKAVMENCLLAKQTELVLDRYNALRTLIGTRNADKRFNHLWTDSHCVWTKFCKRNVLEGIRFPVGMEYEDEMVVHKMLYNSHKTVFTNHRFSNYLLRNNSTVHTMPLKGKLDKVDAYMDRYELMKKIGDQSLISGIVRDCVIIIGNLYLEANKKGNRGMKKRLCEYNKRILSESKQYMHNGERVCAELLKCCPHLFIMVYGLYRKVR